MSLEDLPNRPPIDWVGPYQLPVQQEAPPRDCRGPSVVSVLANTVPPYAAAMPMPSIMAAPDANQFFATQTTVRSYATTLANPYGAGPSVVGKQEDIDYELEQAAKWEVPNPAPSPGTFSSLSIRATLLRCGILFHFLRLTLLLDGAIGLGLCWRQHKD